MNFRHLIPLLALVPVIVVSCGNDDDKKEEKKACTVGDNATCADGLECQAVAGGKNQCFCSVDRNLGCADAGTDYVCENVPGGNSGCFPPVYVKGKVFDYDTKAPIEGARVVARDANNAAESGVSITDPAGNYALRVPTARDKDGKPLATDQNKVTLRADAADYLTFPKPPRIAVPIELSAATGDPLTVQTPVTDIALIKLKDVSGLGTIRGKVLADGPRGTLLVAGGAPNAGGGATGIADQDGTYAVFNVKAGTVDVHGYKAGLQLKSASAAVTAGQTIEGIDLESLGAATAAVSGNIEVVNGGSGDQFSVILAVDETFDETYGYGESPPGLRAFPVSGAFSIPNVPDGNYVVLAAFENDFLVRDPDNAIGGTQTVHIVVAGGAATLPQGFKVTGALDIVSPDDPTLQKPVTGTPTFIWKDDSGEDHYECVVFDMFGTKVWEKLDVPGVSGDKTVSVTYGGPPLTPNYVYQFRGTSIKNGGSPIARTEDLRGVFLYQ